MYIKVRKSRTICISGLAMIAVLVLEKNFHFLKVLLFCIKFCTLLTFDNIAVEI